MKFYNEFMDGFLPSKAVKVAAIATLAQSAVLAYFLLDASKAAEVNEKRFLYMHDIVSRHMDKLEEFDIIALRELGLIKDN